jgi:peptidyl-prolyl cis-trans isomerase A (cyclophilin A)
MRVTMHRMLLAAGFLGALATVSAVAQIDGKKDALRDPSLLVDAAPDVFRARFETSKGSFVIEVHRDWAPLAADRFFNLVKYGFYDGTRFFRVRPGFVAQWGIHGDPFLQRAWRDANLKDEPVKQSNLRGFVSFTNENSPQSRYTQVFINLRDNPDLDKDNFPAFGQVVSGMESVDKLYGGYAGPKEPDGRRIIREGNEYLQKEYPRLDFIKNATIQPGAR